MSFIEMISQCEAVCNRTLHFRIFTVYFLKGYCAQMDSDAFIPFASEEITADNAKKIQRYYQVVDETVNLICADHVSASIVGKASTYFYGNDQIGYERKMLIDDFTVSIAYDHALWIIPLLRHLFGFLYVTKSESKLNFLMNVLSKSNLRREMMQHGIHVISLLNR